MLNGGWDWGQEREREGLNREEVLARARTDAIWPWFPPGGWCVKLTHTHEAHEEFFEELLPWLKLLTCRTKRTHLLWLMAHNSCQLLASTIQLRPFSDELSLPSWPQGLTQNLRQTEASSLPHTWPTFDPWKRFVSFPLSPSKQEALGREHLAFRYIKPVSDASQVCPQKSKEPYGSFHSSLWSPFCLIWGQEEASPLFQPHEEKKWAIC